MEKEVLETIESLIHGFNEKGYSRLGIEITKKRNSYLKNKINQDKDEEINELKKVFTKILELVYVHTEAGISQALNQYKMLKNAELFFESYDLPSDKVKVKYGAKSENLSEMQARYGGFRKLYEPLRQIVIEARNKDYIVKSEILKGISDEI